MSLLPSSGVNTLSHPSSLSLNFIWLESGRNKLSIQRLSNRYRIYAGDSDVLRLRKHAVDVVVWLPDARYTLLIVTETLFEVRA